MNRPQTEKQSQAGSDGITSFVAPHERWIRTLGLPIHRGYFVDDVRTVELGWWPERECNAAFLQLAGQEGYTEARVTEVPPGKTLPPVRFALDEVVYVAEGRGSTTVSRGNGMSDITFEWQKHSLFLLPHDHSYQLTNMQGDKPARLLHQNYLPLAMQARPEPEFYFANPMEDPQRLDASDGRFYAEASAQRVDLGQGRFRQIWYGNFFPDMRAWDRLVPFWGRGAGGHLVSIQFPGSENWAHMSVFPAQTYKKAHRHGPGVVIVIPAGEGYSVMWEEGREKVTIPWHEGSVFVPPNRWFHQHFNVSGTPCRYLALHSPRLINLGSENVIDTKRDQIEYPAEDLFIRETFESELAKRGMNSLMPEACYQDPNYEWDYGLGG